MKKTAWLFAIMILCFILQSSIIHFFRINGVAVNLVLVVLIVVSLQTNELVGASCGILVGILWDVFYTGGFGINTLILMLIGFVGGKLSERVYKADFLTNLYFTVLGTVFYHFIFFIIHYFLKLEASSILYMGKSIIIEMVLNIMILYPVYRVKGYFLRKYKIKY
jgi:rod shape-determining protein MreD